MFKRFLEVSKSIYDTFSIQPLLYGSLGLQQRLNTDLASDDIDVLIPDEYVNGRMWLSMKQHMEQEGYTLIDPHEHTFEKDGMSISYAAIEELEDFAGIEVNSIPLEVINGVHYYLLTLEDYLKVYKISSTDGYRIDHKNKQDNQKIELIKAALGKN